MRLLLKEDQETFNSINKYIGDNWDKRTPDLTKHKTHFYIKYCVRDLENKLLMEQLRGSGMTEYDYIMQSANSKPEYVVPNVTIKNEVINDYKEAYGDVYCANKEFIDKYEEQKYYIKLSNLAAEYLKPFGSDSRNFYEYNNAIYYGHRERNKFDAYLIGDIVGGTFIMSSSDYDNVLRNLKINLVD